MSDIKGLLIQLKQVRQQLSETKTVSLKKRLEAEILDIENLIEFRKSLRPKQLTIPGLKL